MIFPYCDGCGLRLFYSNVVEGKCIACGTVKPRHSTKPIEESEHSFKCVKPNLHTPQFEGKQHCKTCYTESIITEITGEEE